VGSTYEVPIYHTVLDRPLFRAGETVSMKHFVRRHVSEGIALPERAQRDRTVTIVHYGSGQTYTLAAHFDANGVAETTWKIPAEAKLGDFANARHDLAVSQSVLRFYPEEWQTQARLSRAETGLAQGDLASANDALDQLSPQLSPRESVEARLYEAQLLAAQSHMNEAISRLRNLEQTDYAPVAVKATYARVEIELAAKKIKHKYQFSKEGAAELTNFHQRIIENLKLAFGVFMSGDVKVARKLIEEKAQLRSLELTAAESHLARLREGRPESIETTSLHLDVLRDLKRIHSHICSAAYPVLEAAGELEPSRLRRVDSDALSALPSPTGGTANEVR